MNLIALTPLEIDEALAALWNKRADVQTSLGYNYSHTHSLLGERSRYVTKTRVEWPTTHAEAIEKVKAGLAAIAEHYARTGSYIDSPGPIASYNISSAQRTLASIERNREEIAGLGREIDELEAEFCRRPWSRFFLVTSSVGHIHSSMCCHTCRPTTEYGWRPDLSGKSEAEAVDKLGPALCSVCFQSAPVAHQANKITKARAAQLAAR